MVLVFVEYSLLGLGRGELFIEFGLLVWYDCHSVQWEDVLDLGYFYDDFSVRVLVDSELLTECGDCGVEVLDFGLNVLSVFNLINLLDNTTINILLNGLVLLILNVLSVLIDIQAFGLEQLIVFSEVRIYFLGHTNISHTLQELGQIFLYDKWTAITESQHIRIKKGWTGQDIRWLQTRLFEDALILVDYVTDVLAIT